MNFFAYVGSQLSRRTLIDFTWPVSLSGVWSLERRIAYFTSQLSCNLGSSSKCEAREA